jgi:hypothetical protein
MARASKRVKKPTDEFPPLYMVVERGQLHPAFTLDHERLDSYRNGTKVLVWMAPDGDRPLVRRWWATIGNYLKHTTLPWRDKETASAAIKLALAMVEPFKTPSGQWSQYPRSLTDIEDPDLENCIREMEQLLFGLTGVHVDDLRKETGGYMGDEPFQPDQPNSPAADNDAGLAASVSSPSDAASPSPDDAAQAPSGENPTGDGATVSSPQTAVAGGDATSVQSAEDTTPETGAQPGSGGADAQQPVSAAAPELSADDRKWLTDGARMMLGAQPEASAEAKDVLFRACKGVLGLMPRDASDEARNRLETIRQHCFAVCRGEAELDVAMIAATALSTVKEITPAPVKMGARK